MDSSSSMSPCVCFDQEVRVRWVPNRLDYTAEERDELWYCRMEKQAMLEGSLKAAVDLSPDDRMARGLEAFTFEGCMMRRENRQRAAAAILREQARQKRLSTKNGADVLARAAEHITRSCQERANAIGHADEVEAFPQWHEKLPPPTRDEFPQKRFSFFGWLKRPSQ